MDNHFVMIGGACFLSWWFGGEFWGFVFDVCGLGDISGVDSDAVDNLIKKEDYDTHVSIIGSNLLREIDFLPEDIDVLKFGSKGGCISVIRDAACGLGHTSQGCHVCSC